MITDEQIERIIEMLSDRNGALTELARSRRVLMERLSQMSFNPNNGDENGSRTKLKFMQQELRKIDKLLKDNLK